DVDLSDADNAVDRRRQPGIAELHLCRFDQSLVGLDGGLELTDLRLLRFDQLRRSPTLVPKLIVTLEIGAGVGELGLIAFEIARELIDLRLIWSRIYLREQITRMHGLALGEVDTDDLALNLGSHHIGVVSDDGADTVQIDRDIMLRDRAGD